MRPQPPLRRLPRASCGFVRRASLSQIEIESIGGAKKRAAKTETKSEAAAPAAPAEDQVNGMPAGYEGLTVAAIKEQSPGWTRPMLEAALEYEQAHGKRKGALAAVEAALTEKESD